MPVAYTVLLTIAAFLAGSVPFGLLIGFAHGVDIRQAGSGNIGATNLTRTVGRRWGILAFVLDFAKGLLPALAAALLADRFPEGIALGGTGWPAVLAGSAAILGHVYPPWLGFRGGKGVATAFGVVTAVAWGATLAAGATWLVLYLATRVVSVASLAAAAALPTAVALLPAAAGGGSLPGLVLTGGAAALIIYRHRSNIVRLLSGEELAFRKRSTEDDSVENDNDNDNNDVEETKGDEP